MKPSLSVLVPLFNGQATIGLLVSQLLDVLPELTSEFEILVIDDGSFDATSEVAHEISLGYPQVGVLTQPDHLGATTALRHGLQQTTGEWVLFRDHKCPAEVYELDKLWKAAPEHDMVVGRVALADGEEPAFQLFRRRVTQGWQAAVGEESLRAYLARKGYRVGEVEIRDRNGRLPTAREPAPGRLLRLVGTEPSRVDAPATVPPARPSKRFNYLAKLKAFAWGE